MKKQSNFRRLFNPGAVPLAEVPRLEFAEFRSSIIEAVADGRKARPVFTLMAERYLGADYAPDTVAAETGKTSTSGYASLNDARFSSDSGKSVLFAATSCGISPSTGENFVSSSLIFW